MIRIEMGISMVWHVKMAFLENNAHFFPRLSVVRVRKTERLLVGRNDQDSGEVLYKVLAPSAAWL